MNILYKKGSRDEVSPFYSPKDDADVSVLFYFVYRINYILSYDLVYNKLRIAIIVECLIVMIRDAVESVS